MQSFASKSELCKEGLEITDLAHPLLPRLHVDEGVRVVARVPTPADARPRGRGRQPRLLLAHVPPVGAEGDEVLRPRHHAELPVELLHDRLLRVAEGGATIFRETDRKRKSGVEIVDHCS